MRRSILRGFGVVAIFVLAACTDQSQPGPLLPSGPFMAAGGQCDGSLASQIGKEQKELFSGAALTDLQDRFKVIKSLCPSAFPQMMDYLKAMLGHAALPAGQTRAGLLAAHLGSITLYVTDQALVRSAGVFMGDGLVEGGADNGVIPDGGAAVLFPGDQMQTYDGQAALLYRAGTSPGGAHLFTWEPKLASFCQSTLRANTRCYDLKDYPHETLYDPALLIAMCARHDLGPTSLIHTRTGFGTEVLPEDQELALSCKDTHPSLAGWLRREAGPVGHVLARTVEFLGPRVLYAGDGGVSGELGAASPVGAALTVVFEDDFNANPLGPLPNGTDPVVGDFPSSWLVMADFPGYVQVQNGLGDMAGKVVEISQALGNCSQCPTVKLLGTRVNPSATDTIGTYDITWTSLQNKPSVKEAPFVVLSHTGTEIARLSYVSEMGSNLLKYNGSTVNYNAAPLMWTRDVHQDFKITVNLLTVDGVNSYRTSLAVRIGSTYQTVVSNAPFLDTAAKTLSTIGYVMTGIDAGIIAADNFLIQRQADIP
jgi:hypothetical protein